MDKIYLMRLEEIKNLEAELLEKLKQENLHGRRVPLAMMLRNRLRSLPFYREDIPEEERRILTKRFYLYNEYPRGDAPDIELINEIKNNPTAKLLDKQTSYH